MENTIIQRVNIICDLKSKSVRDFSFIIGLKYNTVNQQIKGERAISLDTIISILNSFEDISAEWLLRGEGEMLKNPTSHNSISNHFEGDFVGGQFSTSIGGGHATFENKNNNLTVTKSVIENKEEGKLGEEINMLKRENTILKTQVEEKDRFIKMLLDKH